MPHHELARKDFDKSFANTLLVSREKEPRKSILTFMTSALRILDRFEESANGRRFSGLWLADFGLDGMTMFGSAKDVSFFGIIQFCFFL